MKLAEQSGSLAESFFGFRNTLHDQGIIFVYSGYVTEPVLKGIGETLKQKLVLEDADTTTMRNVFAIFVEQMQNIIRYSAEKEPLRDGDDPDLALRYGVLAIGIEDGKFFVTCGNKVHSEDVGSLTTRLAQLQTLGKEDLRSLYKQKLRGPTEPTSKGAGLGFIEIARRSSKIIDFDFTGIDDVHSFFCLKAYV